MVDLVEEFRLNGRAAKPLDFEFVRELEPSDLAALQNEQGIKAVPLKRLAQRHHALARCLASGMRPGEAATSCGYDPSRVSILQADASFKELVHFYSANVDAQYQDFHAQMAATSTEALAVIRDRLEESPEDISTEQLRKIVETTADRTGHGPESKSSSSVSLTVNMADRLEAARKRVESSKMIELTVNREL